jgi:ABC-2 type transport system permease protein
MSNLLRSEWIKIRTLRLNWILPLIGFAFVVVITGLIALFGEIDGFTTIESGEIAEIVGVSAILPGLLISVIGVLAISSEFGYGTIRPTLVATPNRTKVFLAKAMILAVIGFMSGLVIGLVGYILGFVILSARGAEGLTFLDSDGTIGMLFLGLPVLFTLLALFGYGLGMLIRISAAAVSVAILWPILIETIIAVALSAASVEDPQKFLPYQSALALVSTNPDDFANGKLGGGLFFAAVVAVLIAIASVVNNGRDV